MRSLRGFTVLLVFVAAAIAIPGKARAGSVVITDYNLGNSHFINGAAGGGGPFEATTTGGALGATAFVTFCLEYNEHFSLGQTYEYALSDGAMNGGVAGGNPDPVSDATKWLYYEVVSGAYASMYSAATGLGLSSDVGANFQYAIWFLEEERTSSEIGGTNSAGYRLADYALSNQNWGALSTLGNRVYAMNVTDAAGGHYQDQLAYTSDPQVPVPEPASLTLLGTGLLLAYRQLRKSTT